MLKGVLHSLGAVKIVVSGPTRTRLNVPVIIVQLVQESHHRIEMVEENRLNKIGEC